MRTKKDKTIEPWKNLAEILGVTDKNYLPMFDDHYYVLDQDTNGHASILSLVSAGWQFVNKPEHLPYAPGIYIIHNGERENLVNYLYVGQGYDIANRLYTHPLWQRAIQEYASPIILFWAFNEVQQRDLLIFESYMIGQLKPAWNFENCTATYCPAPRCPKCLKRKTEPVSTYLNKQRCLACNHEWMLS